jgi:hypothetical protein
MYADMRMWMKNGGSAKEKQGPPSGDAGRVAHRTFFLIIES